MESIKLALMQRLKEALPCLCTIDEDYGQLEYNDDQYPVITPAVFINMDSTEWRTESAIHPILQLGTTQVTLKYAIKCYDDTHLGSSTEDKIREREEQAEKVFLSVQGYRNARISPMTRTQSREYTSGDIKVYETTFEFQQRILFSGK